MKSSFLLLIYGYIYIFLFFFFITYIIKVVINWLLNLTKLDDVNKNWLTLVLNIIISSTFAAIIGWTRLEVVLLSSVITSFIWFLNEIYFKKSGQLYSLLIKTVPKWLIGILSFILMFMLSTNISGLYDPLFIKQLILSLMILVVIVRRRTSKTH